jgi:hypothetical protein
MNVLYLLTTVTKTQAARILKDLICVVVIADILGMARFAKVKQFNIYSSYIRKYPDFRNFMTL